MISSSAASGGAVADPARDGTAADFWDDVERHLIRYGGRFTPAIIERAAGSYVYDSTGRAILDFTSGQMSALLGHCHPAIVDTVQRSIATAGPPVQPDAQPPGRRARRPRWPQSLPEPLSKVLLLSTGGESNEAAIRMAKLYTGGHEIVAFDQSYHGVTHGSAAASYSVPRRGLRPHHPGQHRHPGARRVPADDRPRRRARLAGAARRRVPRWSTRQSVGSLAACIVEPILSTGGMIELPPGYLAALKRKCDERGMLLILDEAQTGLCRTGDWYAFQREGVVPDILTLSKTLGAGLPVSAVVTSAEIEAALPRPRLLLPDDAHLGPAGRRGRPDRHRHPAGRGEMDAVARRLGERLRAGLVELRPGTRHRRHARTGPTAGHRAGRRPDGQDTRQRLSVPP